MTNGERGSRNRESEEETGRREEKGWGARRRGRELQTAELRWDSGKKKKKTAREGVIDRRGLFAFVEPTSFISGKQPPSAERLYDRNQSEGNRPYSSTDAPTHRYRQ